MAPDTTWVKARIGDELGFSADDLARLYGVETSALDARLAALGADSGAIYERILSDVEAARREHRQLVINDEHIAALHQRLASYRFHPLVTVLLADGSAGWRLSGDDAQYVAFRSADIVGLDFVWGDVLRVRLNRLAIWPSETPPASDQAFRERVVEVTAYLLELSGVL